MPDATPAAGWREGLERCARWLAEAMRAHPWSTHVPITGPPVTPNAVAWLEAALDALRETGLAEGEKASIALMLSGYVREHVMLMADVEANFLDAAATRTRRCAATSTRCGASSTANASLRCRR